MAVTLLQTSRMFVDCFFFPTVCVCVYETSLLTSDERQTSYQTSLLTSDEIIGLFCKRALKRRLYSAKETDNLICMHDITDV